MKLSYLMHPEVPSLKAMVNVALPLYKLTDIIRGCPWKFENVMALLDFELRWSTYNILVWVKGQILNLECPSYCPLPFPSCLLLFISCLLFPCHIPCSSHLSNTPCPWVHHGSPPCEGGFLSGYLLYVCNMSLLNHANSDCIYLAPTLLIA